MKRVSQSKVVIYSTPSCPWCQKTKDYLGKHHIRFKNIDVSSNVQSARALIKKSGQAGVPVVIIGKKVIIGFNKQELDYALSL